MVRTALAHMKFLDLLKVAVMLFQTYFENHCSFFFYFDMIRIFFSLIFF